MRNRKSQSVSLTPETQAGRCRLWRSRSNYILKIVLVHCGGGGVVFLLFFFLRKGTHPHSQEKVPATWMNSLCDSPVWPLPASKASENSEISCVSVTGDCDCLSPSNCELGESRAVWVLKADCSSHKAVPHHHRQVSFFLFSFPFFFLYLIRLVTKSVNL